GAEEVLTSATLKYTYSWPSTHRKREPVPSVTHTGRWSYVAGSASQAIGTPFGIDARARSSRSRECGWATRNRSSSLAFRRRTTSGSTLDMSGDSPGSHWVAPTGAGSACLPRAAAAGREGHARDPGRPRRRDHVDRDDDLLVPVQPGDRRRLHPGLGDAGRS